MDPDFLLGGAEGDAALHLISRPDFTDVRQDSPQKQMLLIVEGVRHGSAGSRNLLGEKVANVPRAQTKGESHGTALLSVPPLVKVTHCTRGHGHGQPQPRPETWARSITLGEHPEKGKKLRWALTCNFSVADGGY